MSDPIAELQDLLTRGEIEEALRCALSIQTNTSAFNELQAVAHIYIDVAVPLGRQDLAERGLQILQTLLGAAGEHRDKIAPAFHYNMSNAYAAKAVLARSTGEEESAQAHLREQKRLLELALLRREELGTIHARALVNYANVLDSQNRPFEAIDHFALALQRDPEHAIALGNCGWTLRRIVPLSGAHGTKSLS